MKELLQNTLAALGYPVILQGSLAENATYPKAFITFLTLGSPAAAEFDNETALTAWEYQVTFYADNPDTVKAEAVRIRNALKAAGFVPQGKGRDIPSDEPSYTGWTCDYYYLQLEG